MKPLFKVGDTVFFQHYVEHNQSPPRWYLQWTRGVVMYVHHEEEPPIYQIQYSRDCNTPETVNAFRINALRGEKEYYLFTEEEVVLITLQQGRLYRYIHRMEEGFVA